MDTEPVDQGAEVVPQIISCRGRSSVPPSPSAAKIASVSLRVSVWRKM